MSRHTVPDAISLFLAGVMRRDRAGIEKSLALSVVGVQDDERYRGTAGISELIATSPVFEDTEWDVVYAMDSEAVIESPRGDRVHLILDCGRIAFLRVTQSDNAVVLAA